MIRYFIWVFTGRVRLVKYYIQGAAIFLVEDIKDYIFDGRDRHDLSKKDVREHKK